MTTYIFVLILPTPTLISFFSALSLEIKKKYFFLKSSFNFCDEYHFHRIGQLGRSSSSNVHVWIYLYVPSHAIFCVD